jgi:hypothetical protein
MWGLIWAPRAVQSSPATARENWVESYVGWPEDFIAMKVLGKLMLFGSEYGICLIR